MALAHAILASIVDCPCSGYDLAKQFDGSVGFFWKASHQQIYRELSKLETQGWINSDLIPQERRPDKKLYCVTELGKQQLRSWIAQASVPTPIKDDLLVKVFAGYIDPHQIILQLERHHKAHLERLSEYNDLQRRYFQNPQELPLQAKFQYLTLLRGIRYETDWVAWCDEAIHLLSEVK